MSSRNSRGIKERLAAVDPTDVRCIPTRQKGDVAHLLPFAEDEPVVCFGKHQGVLR